MTAHNILNPTLAPPPTVPGIRPPTEVEWVQMGRQGRARYLARIKAWQREREQAQLSPDQPAPTPRRPARKSTPGKQPAGPLIYTEAQHRAGNRAYGRWRAHGIEMTAIERSWYCEYKRARRRASAERARREREQEQTP